MSDPFYPTIDFDFIKDQIISSEMLEEDGIIKVGSSTAFVFKGKSAIYKRTVLLRELQQGQICLEQATYLAAKYKFLSKLVQWLEYNRNWKEGAYIVPQNK